MNTGNICTVSHFRENGLIIFNLYLLSYLAGKACVDNTVDHNINSWLYFISPIPMLFKLYSALLMDVIQWLIFPFARNFFLLPYEDAMDRSRPVNSKNCHM
jgi:hypothetical protein